jgi:hypothetical protein
MGFEIAERIQRFRFQMLNGAHNPVAEWCQSYELSVHRAKILWKKRQNRHKSNFWLRWYYNHLTIEGATEHVDALQILYNHQSINLDHMRSEMFREDSEDTLRLQEGLPNNMITITAVTNGFHKR